MGTRRPDFSCRPGLGLCRARGQQRGALQDSADPPRQMRRATPPVDAGQAERDIIEGNRAGQIGEVARPLARALLTQPILLLLDEPTTGLDPRSKLEVQDFIREIRKIHDATILLCTHDLDEAEALADRVGILDDGRLLALEPVDELKRRYGAETLEEAFFAATGRSFEDEKPEEDD